MAVAPVLWMSHSSVRSARRGQEIAWALAADVLIVRIPLGHVARRAAALKVLAAIKREMGR